MTKLLICQHAAYEILGTLNPLLKTAGVRINYTNFDRFPDATPTLDGYDGLILLGGPQHVYELDKFPHLKFEMSLVESAMKKNIPVLGICLGAQIVAATLGAKVQLHDQPEIGWYDIRPSAEGKKDPILSHLGDGSKIFEWHIDRFEIPKGAVHLAESSTCASQAFRYGKNVYGFQFHLEADEKMVEGVMTNPDRLKELSGLKGVTPESIRVGLKQHIQDVKGLSSAVFGEFIQLLGHEKKYRRLPSR
jgi:GMP synthase (glutamine-hydrolysing)